MVSFGQSAPVKFGTSLEGLTPLSRTSRLFPKADQLPAEYQAILPYNGGSKVLINGELREWTGRFLDVTSPVMVQEDAGVSGFTKLSPLVVGKLPAMTPKEAMEALDAATAAYDKGRGEWPMMTHEQRIGCLQNFIEAIKPKRELVARLESLEIGKSYEDCLKEFDRTVEYMNKSIEALRAMDAASTNVVEIEGKLKKEIRTAKGVALCFGPYNYPLNESYAGMIPALLMGNTIIAKLPKLGSLCTTPLLEAFQQSFPKGVINYLSCDPADDAKLIQPIMESGKIDILSFIGSEKGANAIEKMHPKPNRLTSVLGLGAKNPAVILPGADLDKAVQEAVTGALSYNGQRCTALKVFFVPEGQMAQDFAEKLTNAVNSLKVGMPYEKGVKITPLPNEQTVAYMKSLVDDARAKGAVVLNEAQGGGTFAKTMYIPAVLGGVTPEMAIYRSEQFGPVVPIVTYKNISEVVDYVADSEVGQQASIFGKDNFAMNWLVGQFKNQFCRININEQCQRSPDEFAFDGRKNSAKGTLSITDALKVFSTMNMVTMKATDENRARMQAIGFEPRPVRPTRPDPSA
jgi:acyl-CoA reductase-like NAD-dependent aldehyde dehydrogenase